MKTIKNKAIIKEVFKTYEEPKFRMQFNKAEKMMEELLNQALELKEKDVLGLLKTDKTKEEIIKEIQG